MNPRMDVKIEMTLGLSPGSRSNKSFAAFLMNHISSRYVALASVALLFAACESDPPPREVHEQSGYHAPERTTTETTESEETTPRSTSVPSPSPSSAEASASTNPTPEPTATNPPPASAPKVGNYEYGTKVPGKVGYVTSPYNPYDGYVDVRGFPPGTEVKDPYSGKIFLVP